MVRDGEWYPYIIAIHLCGLGVLVASCALEWVISVLELAFSETELALIVRLLVIAI